MAKKVTQVEKELMWTLYQKYGTFKAVAEKMGRSAGTVSRYVHEYEAAVSAASVVLKAQNL
ncbi:hypothetical protein DWV52_03815 [Ruminococcaceae bacterium AF10-16]|jgi:transposase|nr:hypothetical protein DWV52_03815 [Ruminococcaceae bacterium AF10-16]